MIRKTFSDGFVSLITFVILSALLLWAAAIWVGILRMEDLTAKRITYEKEFWLSQGALSCAIAYGQTLLVTDSLDDEKKLVDCYINPWPPAQNLPYSVQLHIQWLQENEVYVQANLMNNHATRKILSCFLVKEPTKPVIRITKWTEHALV